MREKAEARELGWLHLRRLTEHLLTVCKACSSEAAVNNTEPLLCRVCASGGDNSGFLNNGGDLGECLGWSGWHCSILDRRGCAEEA